MIVAFSTSSPLASVAILSRDGDLIASAERLAPRNASGVCLELLVGLGCTEPIRGFAADTGPGSFIGARVAVTLAKTLAFARGVPCYGAPAFDLISTAEVVAIPNRKNEWLVRYPGEAPIRTGELPANSVGYGEAFEAPHFPHAKRFAEILASLVPIEAERLMPTYLVEPSISLPRTPYREAGA